MNPKVSVIITVFNGEHYFDRAIPSILSQTYENFELIIIDDGSTDNTLQLLKEVASRDHRIKIFSPGRLGRAKALNYAVSQCCGEYILEQDFDDKSYPDRIKLQVEFLDRNNDIGVLGGYYLIVDENRNERYIRMAPIGHQEIVKAMARYIPFAHTTVAFRKEAWLKAGGYPEVPDLEDIMLWINFASLGWKCANLPDLLGEHYVHEESFWHRNFRYTDRQRNLAAVQATAIKVLKLPFWMNIYPIGRYIYAYCPSGIKKMLRRSIGKSSEKDVPIESSI